MIEIEKKLRYTPENEKQLAAAAQFIGEKKIHDIYYDTVDYALTTKDWWLRRRDHGWELKTVIVSGNFSRREIDSYHELEDDESIRKALNLPHRGTLQDDLESAGYHPFADFVTTRRKYRLDEFTIDLDQVDFGDFSCRVGEVELKIERTEDMAQAQSRIVNVANRFGFQMGNTLGKVVQYIKARRPEHFQALVRADVVDE